jgi:hypothetical protein
MAACVLITFGNNSMNISTVRTLPEDDWRRFVQEHPAGNIFHTPEMFHVFERAQGHQSSLWAAIDGNHQLLALMTPVRITLAAGPLHWFTTRAVVYGGVLCAPGIQGQEALQVLLNSYNRETQSRILFTEMRNLSDMQEWQPVLRQNDFAFEGHLNFLIDLSQPEETIWRNISKSGRQSVRTSLNKKVIVEDVMDRQKMAIGYHLLRKVYRRARVPLVDHSLFQAAFDMLVPQGMLKLFLARAGENYIGASLFLIYKERIINWYAAIDRAFAAYSAGELLIWHALRWGQEHHFRLFDFGGGGKPDEDYGPREFKAKFGGALVNYGRNTCIHAPLVLQVSKKVYACTRLFWSLRSAV